MEMFDTLKQKLFNNATKIDLALSELLDSDASKCLTLTETQKYGLLGGKKIRAFLVVELCRILNGNINNAIPYACAIEMIHASSLIHDDMPCMDNDDMRRGKPSTHKAFGETAALLAGDALIVKAFLTISNNLGLSSHTNIEAISILASSSGDAGMLAGQGIDTLSTTKVQSLHQLIQLHNLKTGKLISASAKLGCLSAGIDENDYRYELAVKYANNLGLAFQIIDDLLDYNDGKLEDNSFLAFMNHDEAVEYAAKLTNEAIDIIKPIDDGTLEKLARYLTVREY